MDSIIFDLDGTIWDPIDTVIDAWNRTIDEHPTINKQLTREDFQKTMGLQMHEISRRFFPDADDDVRKQLIDTCGNNELDTIAEQGGSLYENVPDVLKVLAKKYKLYIVSNCQDGYIEVFYQYHQLDEHFLDYENPGRTGLSKGENIKLIMERNNLDNPIYVGDTEGDMKAAKFAGIPFVYAKYGFGQVSEYDEVIERFDDLLRLYGE
ncbi:HAD family hydrolase [Alkalihalobacillus sp. R86527]|uniref:HAD family hydrolase n=1 Tax=Alkalihalobacillus sp. R86527 TaxID=3093863 RepID=UPI00366C5BA3